MSNDLHTMIIENKEKVMEVGCQYDYYLFSLYDIFISFWKNFYSTFKEYFKIDRKLHFRRHPHFCNKSNWWNVCFSHRTKYINGYFGRTFRNTRCDIIGYFKIVFIKVIEKSYYFFLISIEIAVFTSIKIYDIIEIEGEKRCLI